MRIKMLNDKKKNNELKFDEDLLSIICCPNCQNDLTLEKENLTLKLRCVKCFKYYQIKNGIPILLTEKL